MKIIKRLICWVLGHDKTKIWMDEYGWIHSNNLKAVKNNYPRYELVDTCIRCGKEL